MPHGPVPAFVRPGAPLVGRLRAPGDGSVSHLALVLGLLAVDATTIEGLAEGADVLRTARACAALGARVERLEAGLWRVSGMGVGGLVAPAAPLDCGGSGLAAALLTGAVGAHPVTATIDADAALRGRASAQLVEPLVDALARMGAAAAVTAQGHRLPLTLTGPRETIPIVHEISPGSAFAGEIASALLIAGLNSPGLVTVIEPEAACDDAVGLLRLLGAEILVEPHGARGRAVRLRGQPELRGTRIGVPADPFASACAVVAALIAPGSDVLVEGVAAARLDSGLLPILGEMGAHIAISGERVEGVAPVVDLRVRSSRLAGVTVPPERAASLRDEIALLAVAAAFAAGETRIAGLERACAGMPDRPRTVLDGLAGAGVDCALEGDALVVRGASVPPAGGGRIAPGPDPRAAMAFAVLGLGAARGVAIDDTRPIAAAFPTFAPLMRGLGAKIEETA